MNNQVYVTSTSDLASGEWILVEVDNVEIGVFNVDDDYYAIRNVCPHQQGPVCKGKVTNALVGEWPGVGQRIEERMAGDPAIACPWHGWEFDMSSGVHLGDDSFSVETYDVVVEDDGIYLEL